MSGRRLGTGILLLFAFFPWLLFFVWPVISLWRTGDLVGSSLSEVFLGVFDPLLLSKVRFTAGQALLSAAISGVVGLPLGLALRRSPRAASWLKIPFGVPTLVASAAWISILSGSSLLYSAGAVILAHVVFNVPWVAAAVVESSRGVPRVWDDLARSLGAGKWRRWRDVYLPIIGPSWLAATSQVVVFCIMSFGLVLLLGGGPPVETLETGIYSSIRSGSLDLVAASRLAFWQLVLCLAPWLALRSWKGPPPLPVQASDSQKPEPKGHLVLGMIWVLPYLIFLKDLDGAVLVRPAFWQAVHEPLALSAALSACVALCSLLWVAIAMAALLRVKGERRRALLEFLLMLPSGMSTLTLSFGFWLAYSEWVDPFEGSFTVLVLVQALIFFPTVFRWLWPVFRLRSQIALEAAQSLGATPFRAWLEVEWPRLRPAAIHALAVVTAASLGELAAVSFFASEKMVTLPALVSRWLSQYRFEYAHAAAVLLLGASVLLGLCGKQWSER